jgi:predicted permease
MFKEREIIEKIIISLAIIVLGIALGAGLRRIRQSNGVLSIIPLEKIVNGMTRTALIGFSPLIIVGVFWVVEIQNSRLILLPALGVFCLVLGGVVAIGFSKILKLNRFQTGAMFTSGSFYNWGSFGTLFCFMLLGEESLVFVALFRLVEEFVYYTIGFPIAKTYGMHGEKESRKQIIIKMIKDPFIMAAFLAIAIGGILNFSPVERPNIYETFINISVPLFTFLLVIPIGYNMRFTTLKGYLLESFTISIVKFIVIPASIVSLAYFIGFGSLHDGMVLKVILILTAMPPAFISLIPPKLYGLDVDLANSSLLINMGLLIFIVPLLYLIIQFM